MIQWVDEIFGFGGFGFLVVSVCLFLVWGLFFCLWGFVGFCLFMFWGFFVCGFFVLGFVSRFVFVFNFQLREMRN